MGKLFSIKNDEKGGEIVAEERDVLITEVSLRDGIHAGSRPVYRGRGTGNGQSIKRCRCSLY